MILKMRTSRGWLYRDGIDVVQHDWPVCEPEAKPGSSAVRYFRSQGELAEYVNSVWGQEREFVDELWPEFTTDGMLAFDGPNGRYDVASIRPTVLTLRRGGAVLALVYGEAYLLSDEGKTLERL